VGAAAGETSVMKTGVALLAELLAAREVVGAQSAFSQAVQHRDQGN